MKKISTIVLLTVLVVASFSVLSSLPHANGQTTEVQVLSYSWYTAPVTTATARYIGDLIAVGEVQNIGSTTVGSVWVSGQAYNSTGSIVAYSKAQVMTNNLASEQKAPFYMDFIPENSVTQDQSWVPDVTNITISATTILESNATQYSGLTVSASSTEGADINGVYTISGLMQNTGSQNVQDAIIVATFYNSAGTVVALNATDLSSSIAPGQPVPFTLSPTDNTPELSSSIANYAIILQPIILTTQTTSSTTSPTIMPTLSPTTSPTTSVQPTSTGAQTSLTTYIIIAAIVVAAILAGFMILKRTQRNTKNKFSDALTPT